MNKNKLSHITVIFKILVAVVCTLSSIGCSSRLDPVISGHDGSVLFFPKDSSQIDAEVSLYKGIDDEGRPLAANIFTTGDKSKVYASVKLLNRSLHPGRDIMVHIDWINPDGNSFFMKREDISSNDTISEIKSSISIPSERRDPGNYKFRVYLFRELTAEKSFSLVNYNADSASVFLKDFPHPISAEITLGSSYGNGNIISKDPAVFEIKNKAKVFADVRIINKEYYKGKEFSGEIVWCSKDGKAFYTKDFSISPFDSSSELTSAISANEGSREPGNYILIIYLYDRLIGEKSFLLLPEKKEELKPVQIKGIEAGMVFCTKVGRKTKKAYGIAGDFVIKQKGRVHTVVSIKDTRAKSSGNQEIRIEWIDPDGNSFYSKIFKSKNRDISSVFTNSISVTPKKRKPGTYQCRVYLNKSLIVLKPFTLTTLPD